MPTLYVEPKFSYMLASLILFFHALAIAGVFYSSWPQALQIGSVIAILVSMLYSFKIVILGNDLYVEAFWLQGENWFVRKASKAIYQVELLPQSYVSNLLTVLRFKIIDQKKKHTLIIPFDAQSASERAIIRRQLKLVSIV